MKKPKQIYALGKDKRGLGIGDLPNLVMILVVAIIFLGVGLLVLDKFHGQLTVGSEAEKATNASIVGIGDFSDWIPTIVVVVAAAIILGLIVTAFVIRAKRT